jgi:hypothetical protein
MTDEKPSLISKSMDFINLMFWVFAIVGMVIIVWTYRDNLSDFVGKVAKSSKKIFNGKS